MADSCANTNDRVYMTVLFWAQQYTHTAFVEWFLKTEHVDYEN